MEIRTVTDKWVEAKQPNLLAGAIGQGGEKSTVFFCTCRNGHPGSGCKTTGRERGIYRG